VLFSEHITKVPEVLLKVKFCPSSIKKFYDRFRSVLMKVSTKIS